MIYFNKSNLLLVLAVVLLTACGQGTTDNTTTSSVQKTSQTTQVAPALSSASSADLLISLAVTYPNGQIPATSAAQAAKELAQNPAVLHVTAANAQNAKSASVQPQAVAADYKAVTRIQNTSLTGAYFFTIYDTERTTALANNPNWKLEGAAFWASLASGTGLNSVHRFRNNLNGSYLYTIYEAEKKEIETNYASTFTYEGVAWYAQQTPGAGWSPLYRFRNLLNGTYLFSAYEAEKDAIVANYSVVFKLEGIAYYVRQDAPEPTIGYGAVKNANGGAYDKTECVKDFASGLIWEGKPDSGIRAKTNRYNNFDSTITKQKTNSNSVLVEPTQADLEAITNSVGFKNEVNAAYLCGYNDWRIPTVAELEGLANKTTRIPNSPTAAELAALTSNTAWFPGMNDLYWSSQPYVGNPILNMQDSMAYLVSFYNSGTAPVASRGGYGYHVRLVR